MNVSLVGKRAKTNLTSVKKKIGEKTDLKKYSFLHGRGRCSVHG